MARIGSDAGHGGDDPGAIGKTLRLEEEDVTLDIVAKANKEWIADGHQVVTTRTGDCDVSLSERSAKLKAAKLDAIISVHVNSSNAVTANYVRAFVYPGRLKSRAGQLGRNIVRRIADTTGWSDAGLPVAEENFHMTRETNPDIAVLIEVGFISNSEQEKLLANAEFRAKIAHAIVLGTYDTLGIKPPATAPPAVKPHWAKVHNDELMAAGLLVSDHTATLDKPATEGFVITLVNQLRREVCK